jgi:hypothetical protein
VILKLYGVSSDARYMAKYGLLPARTEEVRFGDMGFYSGARLNKELYPYILTDRKIHYPASLQIILFSPSSHVETPKNTLPKAIPDGLRYEGDIASTSLSPMASSIIHVTSLNMAQIRTVDESRRSQGQWSPYEYVPI